MTIYRFKDIGFRLAEGSSLIKAADAEALDQAQDLINSAQHRADQILLDAEAQYEAECARGLEEGRAAAEQGALDRLLTEQADLDQKLTQIEASLAGLVSASVRKIIASYSDSDLAEQVVHGALTQMRREHRVQIRLPHALMANFTARVDALVETYPEIELIDLIEDASLFAPNVIVESAIGRIDCNIGDKLDDLENIILNAVGSKLPNAGTVAARTPIDFQDPDEGGSDA